MTLGAAEYHVLYEGDEEPVTITTRANHWLKVERALEQPAGTLEQVLRVVHVASGSDLSFDDWVDTVDDWERVKVGADAVPPPDPSPSTSPS